jgi:hypothetical protein
MSRISSRDELMERPLNAGGYVDAKRTKSTAPQIREEYNPRIRLL